MEWYNLWKTDPVPGTITVTSTGGTEGKDVAIQFANDQGSFTVDAGSKVVGKTGADGTTEANPNDTLTGIEINGQNYKLGGGKTYTDGDGITIATDDNNKISVNAGEGLTFENPNNDENKGKLKVNVGDGLSITNGKVVNNFKVTEATQNPNDLNTNHIDGGNWTITDNKGTPDDTSDDVTFKNTTLSSSVTSGNEVNNGKEDDKKVVYGKDYTISDTDGNTATLSDVASAKTLQNVDTRLISTEGDVETINNTLTGAVMYDKDGDIYDKTSVTLGGSKTYDEETKQGGTRLTNVAYATGDDGSEAVNVDYLNDAISDAAENGSISTSDQHLVANTETDSNGVYKPNDDGNVNLIVSDEKGNSSTITIGDVASKEDLDNLKDDVGDLDYSKVEGDTIIDGDSVTDAIGKLDNKIDNITGTATDADNNTVTGGKINSDGTISLTQKDKDSIKLEGQLTDSGVVQEGTSFDKETGTITITSQDKYSGETSSVKVEGIASTEVVGATNKEDLATAYKDADKDGNATTEYITDSESMVEADVALDHAIQDVAGTSYANDMVLSNRIDSVEKRLGNVEERIDKVGAMAAAIANLRTMGFDPEAPTEIAIGVGQYKSETGIAIGVFHYPNQDFMLSASLSSSGDELMGGIGATWKLGRKSAAERAKDEEARHLEQAEEMKKLAQQEKVKAQAQRHAKLLAERQQASQKNA